MRSSNGRSNRIWAVAAATTALLMAGGVAPAVAEDGDDDTGRFSATPLTPDNSFSNNAKSASGRLATNDDELLKRSDADQVAVMVKVDVDPVASYTGSIDGYAATSPEVTGVPIAEGSAAIDAYTEYVTKAIADAKKEVTGLIGSATLISDYVTVYGGFSAMIPAKSAKDVLKLGSIAAVQSNELRQTTGSIDASSLTTGTISVPLTVTSDLADAAELPETTPAPDNDATTFIGADAVWPSLGGRDRAGEGVIVGVIDTGIWPEHPMLIDNGLGAPDGGPWACEFGDGTVGDEFDCNNKLIGAYAMLDVYQSTSGAAGADAYCDGTLCSARDAEGHGTHTATTAVGANVESAEILGIERGPFSGVAPGASVIAYRALGPAGGYEGDLVASIGQAVLDGVDVINYSISGSADPYDSTELAFLDAFAAGIAVNSSAGNSGPGAATANHASPWTTTVGASTSDRAFGSALVLASTDGETLVKEGTTITQGVSDVPVVLAADVAGYNDELCTEPMPADSVTDQVVLCMRGEVGRIAKGYNVLQGGAAGMILANPEPMDLQTDNHFLPAIQLEGPNDDIVSFISEHAGVTATWAQGTANVAPGDVMAGFSSRGPIGPFLKPDITAPGVQVIAGHTPTPIGIDGGPTGELYQAIAGTSMSAPHAAGVSALLVAAHPDWTPGQIKSALMTSSVQDVVNVDGSDAGVFDRGAGSIRADRAIAPLATISESAEAFAASAADAKTRIDLNLPSINADPLPGAVTTTRTVTNVSGQTQVFRTAASTDGEFDITVSPKTLTIPSGQSREITVTINTIGASDGWHEGQVTLTPRKGDALVIPVAANAVDAGINLTQSCTPTTLSPREVADCTVTASNFLPVEVDATIEVAADGKLKIESVEDPLRKKGNTASWSGTLGAAVAPQITGFTADLGPGDGYLPLSLFGISPVGIGDEDIVNFNVPPFLFGGETYTRIGVVSNGYLVIGGGTDADIWYQPRPMPDPAAPNNVLAPLWTDLDPSQTSGSGGVRVGVLGDGDGNSWIVVDWAEVPTYSGNATNTMQTWLQTGATEGVWFTYGQDGAADDATAAATAAENRNGTSAAVLDGLPSADEGYAVGTTPPTAGGTVTLEYSVRAQAKGEWGAVATLSSDALRTTPTARTPIVVE